MLKSLKLMRPHRTVDSDLATYFSDERVRLAFSFQSKYLGMSPFRARACSPSCRSWNTSSASTTRAAAAAP